MPYSEIDHFTEFGNRPIVILGYLEDDYITVSIGGQNLVKLHWPKGSSKECRQETFGIKIQDDIKGILCYELYYICNLTDTECDQFYDEFDKMVRHLV